MTLYLASLLFSVTSLRNYLISVSTSSYLNIYLCIFLRPLNLPVPLYHFSFLFCMLGHQSSLLSEFFLQVLPYTYKHTQIFFIPKIRKAKTIPLLCFPSLTKISKSKSIFSPSNSVPLHQPSTLPAVKDPFTKLMKLF